MNVIGSTSKYSLNTYILLVQRNGTNIVNLHGRRGLENQKLKPNVSSTEWRVELDQVILEGAASIIASIHGVDRLAVEPDTHKSF